MADKISYIKIDDKFVKLHSKFDSLSVIKDDAYVIKDKVYIFKGNYPPDKTKNNRGKKNTGLYRKDDGTFVTVGKSELSVDDVIVQKEQNESLNNLLSSIKKLEPETTEEKKSKISIERTSQQTKEKRKLNNARRIKRDEIINLTIFDDDDLMVRILKEKLNSSSLTMADIYEALGNDERQGYNLFYGLSTRPNMTWKTFEIWCDILDAEPCIIIKDKV
jgi:hypothetical protein